MARKKILLVDDAETVLLMEKMILSKTYDLVVARDGQEAVHKAEQENPDLILLDIVMPRMNGFEACKQIREAETTKKVPIILVTTRGESSNIEIGFQSGCSDYVTKPFDSAELCSKIRAHLGE
jgi:DNA-binding response OmpR family regulator